MFDERRLAVILPQTNPQGALALAMRLGGVLQEHGWNQSCEIFALLPKAAELGGTETMLGTTLTGRPGGAERQVEAGILL
jgi:hypothetical protein